MGGVNLKEEVEKIREKKRMERESKSPDNPTSPTTEKETEKEQQEYARYLSDKSTLDSNLKVLDKNSQGLFSEVPPNNLGILRVLPINYLKWVKEMNLELKKDLEIDEIKLKISSWKERYNDNAVEVESEMKAFALETEGFTLQDLKRLLKHEKEKENKNIKQDFKDKKEREFNEGDFLFSYFGDLTNYLKIARTFYEKQPFHYDKYRIWWLWNPKEMRWQKVDKTDLMNAIDNHTQTPSTNSKVMGEIIEAFKRVGRLNKPKDAKETWVQFKNTIYDLKTGEEFIASPEYFITNPIPWELGNSDKTPVMDKILKEWVVKLGVQDESYILTLKEIMAYTMLSYMPIHRIFCFIGEGLNGKGTYLRLIKNLLGDDNCCATEIEILVSNRFESNKLYKKLACFIGEIDKGVFKKTKTIKSLTGEDTVRIEFKGKDGFDRQNYANPLITTNHLPETTDKTKGFYRRWSIVDFPNEFNEKKNILELIPDEEYSNFCRQSIDILRNLLQRGGFTNDGTIKEREDKYERHSNHITQFIYNYCEPDDKNYIEFSDFSEKYNEWLVSEGLPKKSKVEIGRAIILKGYEKKVNKISVGLQPITRLCISNIKWKGDVEELI